MNVHGDSKTSARWICLRRLNASVGVKLIRIEGDGMDIYIMEAQLIKIELVSYQLTTSCGLYILNCDM